MEQSLPPNFEKQMAEQLSGFQALGRFRKYAYQAAAVFALILGVSTGSREGYQQGVIYGFLGLIGGIAGMRLLTAPLGAMLWFRKWHCPNCSKRLGMRLVEDCTHCGAKLFSHEQS
jgi:hypothetical protein